MAVFANGRYDGRTLVEWVPDIVSRLVQRFDPEKIILFGSVARGETGRDSDVDLLVVLPEVPVDGGRALSCESLARTSLCRWISFRSGGGNWLRRHFFQVA
ncbi:MAG: nucleotidyltransferase domain-containing protein [Bacteroidota bacterium]